MSKGKGLKQIATISVESGLGGATSDGSVALSPADTWVQVPTTAPDVDYLMVVQRENEDGVIRWSFDNGGAPGVTNGIKMDGQPIVVELRGGEVLYFGSTTDGDDVNFTIKEI